MTQTLYGRIYLTAYDTPAHDLYDRTRTGFLLRAAVLAELAIRGTSSPPTAMCPSRRRDRPGTRSST